MKNVLGTPLGFGFERNKFLRSAILGLNATLFLLVIMFEIAFFIFCFYFM